MTTRDDLDRRLSRWLEEEGAQRSPQRLVHATRERISETSQVGSIRALRLRLPTFGQRRRLLVVMAVAATALLAMWLTIGGGAGSHVTTTPFSTTRFLPAIRLGLPSNWDVGLDSRGEFDLRWSGGGTFRYPDGTTFRDGISIFRRPVAEDAVQEALVRCWRDLPALRDVERFDAWLRKLLVNSVTEEFRKRRRFETSVSVLRAEPSIADTSGALADRDELERGFRTLSVEHRTIVILHHYLGLSEAETAASLGIPAGTAKSRLHYALDALRAAIDADARGRGRGEALA